MYIVYTSKNYDHLHKNFVNCTQIGFVSVYSVKDIDPIMFKFESVLPCSSSDAP